MESNKKKLEAFAWNNLGQPKVFKDGVTWQGSVPALEQAGFTRKDFETALKNVSRKVSAPARSDEEKK